MPLELAKGRDYVLARYPCSYTFAAAFPQDVRGFAFEPWHIARSRAGGAAVPVLSLAGSDPHRGRP
jgi:hypothetical protein